MNNRFGLKESDLKNIVSILEQYPQVSESFIFGSRAKGNFENGSDVDIVLKGTLIDGKIINRISYLLNEETTMPYYFDVLNYHTINNKNLISHIDRIGVLFYKNEE